MWLLLLPITSRPAPPILSRLGQIHCIIKFTHRIKVHEAVLPPCSLFPKTQAGMYSGLARKRGLSVTHHENGVHQRGRHKSTWLWGQMEDQFCGHVRLQASILSEEALLVGMWNFCNKTCPTARL